MSSRALNGKGLTRANNEFDRDKAKEESRPHKRTVRTSATLDCQTRRHAETVSIGRCSTSKIGQHIEAPSGTIGI